MGGVAVIVFFSISGFLISRSGMRSDGFMDFMAKRARRIFPALIPCSIFMYVIIGGMINNWNIQYIFSETTLKNILSVISLVPTIDDTITSGFKHAGLNGSLWTLPLEFACYLIVGVSISLWKDSRVFLVVFLIMFGASIYYLLFPNMMLIFFIPTWLYPLRAMAFFFGAILAVYYDRWDSTKAKCFIILALSVLMYSSSRFSNEYTIIGYLLLSFVTISVCTSFNDIIVKGRFDYSYGVYIYAFPVQQVIINKTNLGFYPGMLISALSTIILASLSWHFIEKKFIYRKKEKVLL